MRGAALVLAFAVLAMPVAAAKPKPAPKKEEAPPVTAAHLVREADGTRVDLTWDGVLLGWAIPRDARGHRTLFVLIAPAGANDAPPVCAVEDAARRPVKNDARLFRWREDEPESLHLVRAGLPWGRLDAADLDGSGAEGLLLVRDGGIDRVEGDGALAPLATDGAISGTLGDPRAAGDDAVARDSHVRVVLPGELRTYGRGTTGSWRVTGSSALPVRVVPGSHSIGIQTPAVHVVGSLSAQGMLFATEPEPIGTTRVRTTLLAPDSSPAAAPVECWAQLPAPERVLDNTFAVMDGRAVWIALTMSAEKLSLFAEKTLRLYDLAADRTRVGAAPRAALTTGLNIWQFAYPVVADLDRDGHDDLVLGYWKGLRRSIAALEVYPGNGDGGLGKRRDLEITVDDADEGFLSFGRDADGDGRPDLIVATKSSVLVYPGTAEPLKRPVAEAASRRITVPAGKPGANSTEVDFSLGGMMVFRHDPGFGTPRPIDLDGDGQAELLFVGNSGKGGRVSIVRFRKETGVSLAPGGVLRYK